MDFLDFKKTLSYKKTGIEILQSMISYLKQFETYQPEDRRQNEKSNSLMKKAAKPLVSIIMGSKSDWPTMEIASHDAGRVWRAA